MAVKLIVILLFWMMVGIAGATKLVPLRRLQDLYLGAPDEVREQGLGTDWSSFRAELRIIRRNGFAVTRNIEKAQTRISAPIFRSRGRVIASFSQSLPSVYPKPADIESLSVLVRQCAEEISAQIGRFEEADPNGLTAKVP